MIKGCCPEYEEFFRINEKMTPTQVKRGEERELEEEETPRPATGQKAVSITAPGETRLAPALCRKIKS